MKFNLGQPFKWDEPILFCHEHHLQWQNFHLKYKIIAFSLMKWFFVRKLCSFFYFVYSMKYDFSSHQRKRASNCSWQKNWISLIESVPERFFLQICHLHIFYWISFLFISTDAIFTSWVHMLTMNKFPTVKKTSQYQQTKCGLKSANQTYAYQYLLINYCLFLDTDFRWMFLSQSKRSFILFKSFVQAKNENCQ